MDHKELVELILARVMEKLSQGGDCSQECPCGGPAPDDGRPGLLILTQEHGQTCHSVLEDPRLTARYRTECALLQNYQVDLDRFEAVVIYEFTNETLCKLAGGICDTPFLKLAQQALLGGKRVFVPTEELEAMRATSCKLPAPYCAMLQEKLALLTACGLTICSQQNLAGAILDGACPACAAPAVAPAAAPEPCPCGPDKELCIDKRVLTERDVIAAEKDGVTCIRAGERTILTALAVDYARSKGIRLIRSAGR